MDITGLTGYLLADYASAKQRLFDVFDIPEDYRDRFIYMGHCDRYWYIDASILHYAKEFNITKARILPPL